MRAIIRDTGQLIQGDFKSLDGLTVEWRASDGAIPQALLAAIAAQDVQPDWKGFAAWARDDVALNTAIATALPLKPVAAGGIGATLLQASQGDLDNFAAYFETVCSAALVTSQQRATWADLARDTYNLPADFVAVVRG